MTATPSPATPEPADAAAADAASVEVPQPVAVPDPPPVPGLTFRRFVAAADIPALTAANQAAREAAGALEVVTPESMGASYANLVNTDPSLDILVAERSGRAAGYARVSWRNQFDGSREFETYGIVRPDERGQGIGGAMLRWAQARLAAIAATLPADRPARLGTWTWAADEHATALLREDGWTLERQAHELLRPDLEAIPDLPLSDGIEIRPVGRVDMRRVWEAAVDAFRDHPGEPEPDEADYTEFEVSPRQDPDLWLIAFDGDEIAAGVLNIIEPLADNSGPSTRGLLDTVFTRDRWRRRGLARALIARSLVLLRDRGMADAYLGVDATNPNQAMGLYEAVGFRLASTENYWTKPMPDAAIDANSAIDATESAR